MKKIFQKFSSLTVWILGGNKSKNHETSRFIHETQIFSISSSSTSSGSASSSTAASSSASISLLIREKKLGNRKDLELLIREISSEIKLMSSHVGSGGASRSVGLFLMRDKHESLGRLLAELQRRMRFLDETYRQKYEPRAESLMAEAARLGVTLPPP